MDRITETMGTIQTRASVPTLVFQSLQTSEAAKRSFRGRLGRTSRLKTSLGMSSAVGAAIFAGNEDGADVCGRLEVDPTLDDA